MPYEDLSKALKKPVDALETVLGMCLVASGMLRLWDGLRQPQRNLGKAWIVLQMVGFSVRCCQISFGQASRQGGLIRPYQDHVGGLDKPFKKGFKWSLKGL